MEDKNGGIVNTAESVMLYCDGACSGNPGPGGWGAVIVTSSGVNQISGYEGDTTNNRMELTAAIEGLRHIQKESIGRKVSIYTDSMYLKNGITTWIISWKAANWKRRGGGTVKNIDLWRTLSEDFVNMELSWHWVKGHNGDEYNEMADKLATSAIRY